MTTWSAVLAGAICGLGVLVAAVAWWSPDTFAMSPYRSRRSGPVDRLVWVRTGAAVVAGLLCWLGTGWPVGSALVAAGAWMVPVLWGAKRRRAAAVARIEAIATWAEQLRDVMAAADGIQSAIAVTARTAPGPIRPEVQALADRLVRRESLPSALRRFGADVAHPLADVVVTSLILASERQGRLGDLLSEVAASARATASMRLRVEAVRARTYVTTRLIVGITIGMAVWLVVLRREYLAPFDTVAGQVMLLVIGATFAVSGVVMNRMAQPSEPPRLLVGETPR